MKYRVYVPAIAITRDLNEGKFGILKQVEGKFVHTNEFFDTAKEAQAAIDANDEIGIAAVCKTGIPEVSTQLIMGQEFHRESDARAWLSRYLERAKEDSRVINVEPLCEWYTIDKNDLEDYEYLPSYEVEVEVTTTKTITVTVNGTDEIEDDYDAGQAAIEMVEHGDFDDELDCTEPDRFEVDVASVEEIA
jgi:hypothetical protein